MRIELEWNVDPRRLLLALLLAVGALMVLHLAASFIYYQLWHDRSFLGDDLRDIFFEAYPLFDLRSESSIATWFSAALMLCCALLLAVIWAGFRRQRQIPAYPWAILSVTLLAFSLDEIAGFHEFIEEVLDELYDPQGLFKHAWVVPALVFVAIALPALVAFSKRLPGRFRWLFIWSALVFFGGAVGMELVDGYFHVLYEEHDTVDFFPIKMAYITTEEILELIGVCLFCYSLVAYLEAGCPVAEDRRS